MNPSKQRYRLFWQLIVLTLDRASRLVQEASYWLTRPFDYLSWQIHRLSCLVEDTAYERIGELRIPEPNPEYDPAQPYSRPWK